MSKFPAISKFPASFLAVGIIAGVLAVAAPAALAGAQPGVVPVGPHQSFVGVVNDNSVTATVQVLCPGGPIFIGEKGHPVAGQTVGVGSPSATATAASLGFTGTLAHAIGAQFTPTATSAAIGNVIFTAYGDKPIPSTLLLPCYGTATVLFVPRPTSQTARPARVTVTYEATCGSNVCPVIASEPPRI